MADSTMPSGIPDDASRAAGPQTPGPEDRGAAAGRPEPGPAPADPGAPPETMPIIDAVQDLTQTAVDYARTQIDDIMQEKVVLPAQKLGTVIASAVAAAQLLVLGLGFVAVGLMILLAKYITWPGALCLIGAIFLIGAGVFTYLKVRSMQHERPVAEPGKPVAPADAPGTPPRDPRGAAQEG